MSPRSTAKPTASPSADHLERTRTARPKGLIHGIVANNNIADVLPEAWHSAPFPSIRPAWPPSGVVLIEADVVAEENRYRHDPGETRGYDPAACTITGIRSSRFFRTIVAEEPVLLTR